MTVSSPIDQLLVLDYWLKTDVIKKGMYFNWVELGKIMTEDSSFNGETSFEDAVLTIEGVRYRVPTIMDWIQIFQGSRPGAVVNGTSNVRFAHVNISLSGTTYGSVAGSVSGYILFPDGGTYTSPRITSYNGYSGNSITYADYLRLCSGTEDCVFMPAVMNTNNAFVNNGAYWSSSVGSTGKAQYVGFTTNYNQPLYLPAERSITEFLPVRLIRVD